MDQEDADALCVHLFEGSKEILGCYIGPVAIERDPLVVAYLAKMRTSAASAILQAMGTAIVRQRHICTVDPCDLWAMV